jgi:hypothetical protein
VEGYQTLPEEIDAQLSCTAPKDESHDPNFAH